MTLPARRVLHWDIEEEYRGAVVTFADLPALLARPSFTAVYRPRYARTLDELPREFAGLASLVLACGRNLLLTVDEALTVLPPGGHTGALGELLFRGRKRGISVAIVTQYVSRLPTALLGAVRELRLFRLDGRGDQQVLRSWLSEADCARVATLPPHEYVTVHK